MANIVDVVLKIFAAIGGIGGILAFIGSLLYVRQERAKRETEIQNAKTDINEKIKTMALDLATTFEQKYNAIDEKYIAQSAAYTKVNGKLNRIIQLIRQNVEYRKFTAQSRTCTPECIAMDIEMLANIDAIMAENGTDSVAGSKEPTIKQ